MRTEYLNDTLVAKVEPYRKVDGRISVFLQNAVRHLFASIDFIQGVMFAIMAIILLIWGSPKTDETIDLTKTQLLAIVAALLASLRLSGAREQWRKKVGRKT